MSDSDESQSFLAICEACGKETWWNTSFVFNVGMVEGRKLGVSTIKECSECGRVEGYDGTSNISS